MKLFARKKPVTIEYVQLLDNDKSIQEVCEFIGGYLKLVRIRGGLTVNMLEGDHLARFGDFVIKGVNGEFYPCKPDIFAKTYDYPIE